jgi:hypothetical protein
VTATYGDVDRSNDPERAVDWQERIDAWPAIQAYKRHSIEQLRGQTSVLDVGCGPCQDAAAVKALRRDTGYRNGRLATELPASLASLGVVDISICAFPLLLTGSDDAFGLPSWVSFWRERGSFDDADIEEWNAGISRARRDGMVYTLLYFVVAGTTS